MKKILLTVSFLLILLFTGMVQQSCTKLDEEVYSDYTGDLFFSNPDNLIYAFGVAYTNLYQVAGHKFGLIGMDVGTDILVVPQRGGDWFDNGEWHRWHRHTWEPTEGYIQRWWNLLYLGVNNCNQLISQFEVLDPEIGAPAVAELRALRALYYYWLIDIFGNVPILDRFDYPADYKPVNNTRAEVYDFIERDLLEVMPELSKETGLLYYGRINYYTAQMILAKLYLNAEVYTGTPQWEKATLAVDEIVNSGKYSLSGDFFDSFEADASSSPEVILGVAFDQIYAEGLEIHLFSLHYNLAAVYGFEDNCWNGLSFQEAFFNSFEETDARRNGLLFGPQYDAEGNQVEDASYEKKDFTNPDKPFDPDGPGLNLTPNINMLEPSCLRQCGARIAKFPFIQGSDRYTSNDFPIFRYSDLLLMKAELMLLQGDAGGGLTYVNDVRSRAGLDGLGELTFENLLAERGRELFVEGHRRSDLIRFSTGSHGSTAGVYYAPRWEKPDQSQEFKSLWPIPQSAISTNPNLQQNPGY
jgi:hypothetical protein